MDPGLSHAVIASNATIQPGATLAYVDQVWRAILSTGHPCAGIGLLAYFGSADGAIGIDLSATQFAAVVCAIHHKPNVIYRVEHHFSVIDHCEPGSQGCYCVPGRCTARIDSGPSVTVTTAEALQTEVSESVLNQAYPGLR